MEVTQRSPGQTLCTDEETKAKKGEGHMKYEILGLLLLLAHPPAQFLTASSLTTDTTSTVSRLLTWTILV
jgi:hypothetical protein